MSASLAIVIPAFKATFFARTLQSLANQTDQRFRLYIADDGSPENLWTIVEPFQEKLNLTYRRFENNLGATSLVSHWHRAIAMSDEPWIWLFSDDDMMSPDAVERFLAALKQSGDNACLWRFNVVAVDENDNRLSQHWSTYPEHEGWREAVEAHLRPVNRQCCSIQNVIFPRSVYQAENGFADYPLGYGSDMVTWTRFSRRGGWRTVPEALVFGRVSSLAISGNYVLALRRSNDRILTAGRVFHDWRTTCAEAGARIPDKLWLGMLVDYFRPSGRSTSRQERKLIRRALHEIWPESPTMVNRWYWGYFSAPAEQLWLWRSRLHRLRAWIRKS